MHPNPSLSLSLLEVKCLHMEMFEAVGATFCF